MGVRKNGKIDQVEVPSRTDSVEKLLDRMEIKELWEREQVLLK